MLLADFEKIACNHQSYFWIIISKKWEKYQEEQDMIRVFYEDCFSTRY